jgi:hypothetical protein
MKFLTVLDLQKNELQNAVLQNLATAPGSPVQGQIYYDTVADSIKVYDGAAWATLGAATVDSVTGTSPISVSTVNGVATVSISAASGAAAGSMSSAHYTLVNNSTDANTANTIVKRDASGNFTAGTITAALTGTASNASALGNQNSGYHLSRTNHTGTQTASTISDFDTQVRTSRLDQMAAPTSNLSLNSQKIVSLADPANAQDAATKAYVDATRSGLDVKASVRAATTATLTSIASTLTVDGVSLIAGDRVLVKNQTAAQDNGIYVVAAGSWSRATDADADAEVTPGMFTFVEEGTTNADSGWVLTNNGTVTVGTTELTFVQFSGAGQITAGDGLTKSGNTINVVGTTDKITVSSDAITIASTYVGQSSITTLGTIATGVWNGTDIAVADGGTGASDASTARTNLGLAIGTNVQAYNSTLAAVAGGTYSGDDSIVTVGTITAGVWNGTDIAVVDGGTGASNAAGAKTNLGFMTRYSGSATWTAGESKAVTHSLGTKDVVVSIYDSSDNLVLADVVTTSTTVVTITISLAGTYRVAVIG